MSRTIRIINKLNCKNRNKNFKKFLLICLASFTLPLFVFVNIEKKPNKFDNHLIDYSSQVQIIKNTNDLKQPLVIKINVNNNNNNKVDPSVLTSNTDEIDVVYTWVNGSDPEHAKLVRKYRKLESERTTHTNQQVEYDNLKLPNG